MAFLLLHRGFSFHFFSPCVQLLQHVIQLHDHHCASTHWDATSLSFFCPPSRQLIGHQVVSREHKKDRFSFRFCFPLPFRFSPNLTRIHTTPLSAPLPHFLQHKTLTWLLPHRFTLNWINQSISFLKPTINLYVWSWQRFSLRLLLFSGHCSGCTHNLRCRPCT